jgi:U3 small nucleolar RNA-associated protein 3
MIQKSIALNSVMYILLRCASVGEEDATSNIQAHPVMDHLKKLTNLLENLEGSVRKKTKDIDLQLDNLVKAAALMANLGGDDDAGSSDSDGDDKSQSSMGAIDEQMEQDDNNVAVDEASEDSDDESDEDNIEAIAQKKQRDFERTVNEARFGLRPNEVRESSTISQKNRTRHMEDFGDLDEDEGKNSGNALASTINTIEQRSKTASRKRRPAPVAEELDDLEEHDDRVMQGLKMMEEEMGKIDDGHDDKDNDAMDMEGGDGSKDVSDPDGGDEALAYYNQFAEKSKKKNSFKKSLYKVAPKYPRVDGEVAGERSISKVILKNRGLVAHKPKINRNPRVKKREQYRKALIRRKGAVREVRDAAEGNKYGGEETGIKSRISRSRKL